jgi:LssY C-terminus
MTARRDTAHRSVGLVWLIAVLTMPAGCATWRPPTDTSDAPFRARATTETSRDVRLSATVLSGEDSVRMFGVDVNATGVQPVWIEITNDTAQSLWLLRSGTDPDYFSPLEVAWSAHVSFGGETNDRIDEHFDQLALSNPIPAGQTRSGVLFTNPQPIARLLNVDLLGDKVMIPFTLFLPVPGEAAGSYVHHIHDYDDSEVTHCEDEESLRKAIETLPCCATTAAGAATGEPLNVVIVGSFDDIGAAVARRGYRRDLAPAAKHQLFGRAPDFVIRKRAQAGAPAHWVRMWRAPLAYRDQAVFVAQAGRPIGGRFAKDARAEQLHPDVDEVRNILIQDFLYSGGLEKLGFVTGVGAVSPGQPRSLPDETRYYSDGLRAVLFFATRPLSMTDVEILDWVPLVRP